MNAIVKEYQTLTFIADTMTLLSCACVYNVRNSTIIAHRIADGVEWDAITATDKDVLVNKMPKENWYMWMRVWRDADNNRDESVRSVQ